MISDA
jgi:hypothetical protein